MKTYLTIVVLTFFLALCGCEKQADMSTDAYGFSAPTKLTADLNATVKKELPLDDQQDFKDARRGLIASDPDLKVVSPGIGRIWDQTAYAFMEDESPPSANPSLWRQARLNNIHGLFEVTKGIYQLRGFDLANMTLIEGKNGWIVVDPLTAKETATRALEFAFKHLEKRPITAIIFTHSHIDHFGGATAILSPEEAGAGTVRIIAPYGFMEEAVSENVIAGIAMSRRSMYMYGSRLPRSERGHIGTGLGKEPAMGSIGILVPTEIITRTPEEKVIDGVRFVFQNVPASEAPAEMTFYLPDFKTFCGAEIASHCLHNLYTLRGTKVRDALKWSGYINEAIELFGEADIYFGVHHWPIWGNQRIVDFLKKQRDVYKYIHDQTVRMANAGMTPREISAVLEFPESMQATFSNRGYYGTLSHNAKVVYQFYFGWYDGNPAHLNPLPPVESATRYVEFMGGAENVLAKAQASFDKNDYRWTAEVLNHLVFAEPDNKQGKELLARTYDQLGYQAESGPWRDVYLTGAYELRHGGPEKGLDISKAMELLEQTPISNFLDSMAVRLNGPKADGKNLMINLVFTDLGQSYVLHVENAVLHHKMAPPDAQANATLNITHGMFLRMVMNTAGIKEFLFSDDITIKGSKIDLIRFFALLDRPAGKFNIVTP
ncbi:MAG: MBL fold metallo-hydrolase [Deltaproteobacteria bacterium]|nr:MBL fold metallo-hydrolase [Deltaproteobacteria bacterium]